MLRADEDRSTVIYEGSKCERHASAVHVHANSSYLIPNDGFTYLVVCENASRWIVAVFCLMTYPFLNELHERA